MADPGRADFASQLCGRLTSLAIDRRALAEALEIAEADCIADLTEVDEPIEIAVAIRLQRCGKQVRLILGEVSSKTRSPDGDLVQLVRDGHRWFEHLRCGRAATIAAIARRDREQVSHVSRNLSLAFLAPDVTEMILTGRQPITLTPERLKAARPLPLDWNGSELLTSRQPTHVVLVAPHHSASMSGL